VLGEFAVERAASENPYLKEISAPDETSNKSLAGVAPVTVGSIRAITGTR
jgi:hypothetical protein